MQTAKNESWEYRNKEQAKKDPEFKQLLKILQTIHPNSVLILNNSKEEPWIKEIIERGVIFPTTKIKSFRGRHNWCHINASVLWILEEGSVATGFSYFEGKENGIWRPHSWGVSYNPRYIIIETTGKAEDYFGVELDSEESKKFTASQILPMFQTLFDKMKPNETK